LIMSTITSDCQRLSDFLMVSAFGAGFAMEFSSFDRIKSITPRRSRRNAYL
jgi:hypothetical protein